MRVMMSLVGSMFTLVLLNAVMATESTGSVGTVAAAADDDDDRRGDAFNGRRLFLRENCYICHGGRGGGGMCPSLRDHEIDFDDAEDTIEDGTDDGMPAYEDRLSEREIRDLIAYIRSLRTDREPTFTHWWEPVPSQ